MEVSGQFQGGLQVAVVLLLSTLTHFGSSQSFLPPGRACFIPELKPGVNGSIPYEITPNVDIYSSLYDRTGVSVSCVKDCRRKEVQGRTTEAYDVMIYIQVCTSDLLYRRLIG